MNRIIDSIRNSEFLTFSEVLRLKVAIVTLFLAILSVISIPLSSFDGFNLDNDVVAGVALTVFLFLTILFTVVNLNRFAMHLSVISFLVLTWFYTSESNQFYGFIMFFVSLTVIIFYQDIATYLIYGGIVTGYGVFYILGEGANIVGINSIDPQISMYTYLVVLVGFYLVFLIQFLVSDNIYEKMNNEWVRMNKILGKYQEFTLQHLKEMIEENSAEPVYKNIKFQQTVSELSLFVNEFFEEDAKNITEVVEFYFFLHEQNIEEIVDNKELPISARRYASQLKKYLLNERSELVSILFDFSTLFSEDKEYTDTRYEYNLNKLFKDRIDKMLSLAILYKYLKTEITQFDKWGNVQRKLTHQEIVELFQSKEFREFISYEQVNFFLDNQELFDLYL